MDLTTISLELQQVFILAYAALLFWALVLIAVATMVLALIRVVQAYVSRRIL